MNLFRDLELTDEHVAEIAESLLKTPWAKDAGIMITSHFIERLIFYFDQKLRTGDEEARYALVRIATVATQTLQETFLGNPKFFNDSFCFDEAIPVMMSKQARHREEAAQVIELSRVGDSLGINTVGKQANSEITRLTAKLYYLTSRAQF